MELWEAKLNGSSPRYKDWLSILGAEKVPLLSPQTARALFGAETCAVYLLDWQHLDEEASNRLLDFLAKKFNADKSVIEADLNETGHFPIRESDVIVFYDVRAFL